MGKYEPLRRYLERQSVDSLIADFSQLEAVLGFPLPQSAYRHQAWWANEAHGSHSHSRSWQDAGWETSMVSTANRTVRFQRRAGAGKWEKAQAPESSGQIDLLAQAAKLTGIDDRETLIAAALQALIDRELLSYFSEIGGSQPDFEPAPRERPFE